MHSRMNSSNKLFVEMKRFQQCEDIFLIITCIGSCMFRDGVCLWWRSDDAYS